MCGGGLVAAAQLDFEIWDGLNFQCFVGLGEGVGGGGGGVMGTVGGVKKRIIKI